MSQGNLIRKEKLPPLREKEWEQSQQTFRRSLDESH
jgi:hypothetical protein